MPLWRFWWSRRLLPVTLAGAALALLIVASPDYIDRAGPWVGFDSHAYWAVDLDSLYDEARLFWRDSFLYTPAAAQIIDPLGGAAWPTFAEGWRFAQVALLVTLTGPLAPALLLTQPVREELTTGNISLLMAAAIVAGFRWPGLWAVLLLTKVTPAIGLLWFAARREWRSLAIALGTTGIIFAVSLITVPWLWADWVSMLRTVPPQPWWMTLASPPLALRLVIAAILIMLAARRNQRWILPAAVVVAHGHLWLSVLTVGAASLALLPAPRLATGPSPPGPTSEGDRDRPYE